MLFRLILPLVLALALPPGPRMGSDSPPSDSRPRAAALAELEQKAADLERQLAVLRQEIAEFRRQMNLARVTESQPAEPAIAWGKAANGLQPGLALRPAEKRQYRAGDVARFVLKVRNVSDRPVTMRFEAIAIDARIGPSVLDADGQRPAMSGPIYSGVGGRAINQLVFAAGQEIELAAPELVIGPLGESRVQAKRSLNVGPGKYRVSYHVHYVNADDTMNYMTTGEVELEVLESKGESP